MDNEKIIKKNIAGWYLFDFANSTAVVIGGIYFAKWFIEDVGAGTVAFNVLFFISALIIFFSGKIIGRLIDSYGYKKWILFSSLVSSISLFLLFALSQTIKDEYLVFWTFPIFLSFLVSYQISRICHNTYYKKIIPNALQSKVSGFGATSNWAGSLFGILLTIPIVSYYPKIIGREMTFLVAAIVFSLITPLALKFMFIKNKGHNILNEKKTQIPKKDFKKIFPYISLIFTSYFLIFDVMSTVQRNLPPFLTSVHKLSDTIQSYGFLIILVSAMLGGIFASKKVDENSALDWLKKGTILLSFSIVSIIFPFNITLWGAFVVAGFCYGILESAIRIHFSKSFDGDKAGENFGKLAAVERASGIIGPIFWIIPFTIFSNEVTSYKISMIFLSLITLLAFMLLHSNKIK